MEQTTSRIYEWVIKDGFAYLVTFLLYLITAKFALDFYFRFDTSPALIWPPVGIAVAAAIIMKRYTVWIPVFLAQFITLITMRLVPFYTPTLSLVLSTAYAVEIIFMLYILKQRLFEPHLQKLRSVLTFIIVAFFATMIEPGIVALYLTIDHIIDPLAFFVRSWGAGIFSTLVLAPFTLVLYQWKEQERMLSRSDRIEVLAGFAALALVNYFVFWTTAPQHVGISVIFFIPIVLIWFGLRLNPRWMMIGIFLTAVQGIAGTFFANPSAHPISDQLVAVQIYIGMVAAIFYVFAAVVEERRSAYRKLEEAFTLTAASNKAKTDFIAVLAHELRNPLAPMVSALDLLTHESKSKQTKEIIASAREHASMMQRLLDDLLDIARLGQGKITLKKEPTSLKDIIAQSIASTQPEMDRKKQRLFVTLPERDIVFSADPVRLKQITINLLSNASKYTPDGGTITVTCAREDARLVLRVSDTGIGIPTEHLTAIFEPFRQLAGKEGPSTGLGIGLYLTKSLIEMHEGTITAASEGKNKGTTFTVELPLHEMAQEVIITDPVQERIFLNDSSILIVDDNKPAADLLQKLLSLHGYEVSVAYSGDEAVAKVKETYPQVIFMDIGMPRMDGYAAAREIRKTGWNGAIVALSGYGQQSDKERSAREGFHHHLVKPIGIDELLLILSEVRSALPIAAPSAG
jgi:signal transduction histidine kinase/ActR/RegA family two-component response regulator